MGRGTRAQPARERERRGRRDGGGGSSPRPPEHGGDGDGDDADGERVRYTVSVPLAMWEVRLSRQHAARCALMGGARRAASAQLNQTDVKRDTGSKLCRLGLARRLRLGARWVRARWDVIKSRPAKPRFEPLVARAGRHQPHAGGGVRGVSSGRPAGGARRRGGGQLLLGAPGGRALRSHAVRARFVLRQRPAASPPAAAGFAQQHCTRHHTA